ncbi:MAG: Smr/MutS family protein, partial [Bacteroidota bacterium]
RRLLQIKRDSNKEHEVAKKEQFKSGDVVSVIGQDTSGTIQKINGKQAKVIFGSIKSIISTDRLKKEKQDSQVTYQKKVRKSGIDLSEKIAGFSHDLHIRGMRAEEAMNKIESFLDEALLVGVDQVRIVHGKGHGILRDIVRNISKEHPRVATIEDEHADLGGAGISVIKLR